MPFVKLRIFFIILISILPTMLTGQSWAIKNYTTEDGLPGNMTYQIVQDDKGYLWIGTNNGICRFDGRAFKWYESPLIKNNEVLLCKKALGLIWFATYGNELFYIENDNVREIPLPEDALYLDLIKKTPTSIWVAVRINNQVAMYSYEKGEEGWISEKYNTADALYGHHKGFLKRKDGMYFLSSYSILKWDSDAKKWKTDFKLPVESGINNSIIWEGDWILSIKGKGYCYYRNNKLIKEEKLREVNDPIHFSCFKDSKGRVWEKYISQLSIVNGLGGEGIMDFSPFLGGDRCNEMFEDREGNIWFSTNSNGLFVLLNTSVIQFDNKNSELPENRVWDIVGDDSGKIIVALGNGHFVEMEKENIISSQRLVNTRTETYDVFIDDKKNIFSAIHQSLIRYRGEKIPDIIRKMLSRSFLVKRITQDASDNYWLSCNNVLYELKNDERFIYDLLSSHGARVYVALPTNGKALLGTTKGVYELTVPTREEVIKTEKEIPHREWSKDPTARLVQHEGNEELVSTIEYFDRPLIQKKIFKGNRTIDYYIADIQYGKDSSIWIATRNRGVYHIVNDSIQKHWETETNGWISNVCRRIFVDEKGVVWVSTVGGVGRIDPRDYSVRNLTKDDGLISNHVNSIYKYDSLIYVGTSEGLTIFDENDLKEKETPPPILIESIKINEIDTMLDGGCKLPYHQNSIYFECISLTFKNKSEYEYRLKGLSDQWIETNIDHVRFSELGSGNYTFEVRAVSANGTKSETAATFSFRIKPHPLLSPLAYIIYFLLVLLSVVLYVRKRIRNIEIKEKEKTAINKKFAELELQALQAQMNPHFVFNALNSIQNFISRENTIHANDYLSRFAKLMRLFLESSRKKFISLEEEIMLLEYYTDLEKLRFRDNFEVDISIGEDVETDIEIPSMLLQPFVENAINHGLAYKKEKGYLLIEFLQQDEVLQIKIKDDGVGRKKAASIQASKYKGYESRGTSIVSERLETLKTIEDMNIHIEITDLEKGGLAAGTQVDIFIPIRD